MARQKKNAKRFCCYLHNDILNLLNLYSEKTLIPKTGIIEKALKEYFASKDKFIKMNK